MKYLAKESSAPGPADWQVVIRPDAKLWAFRLSGGMRFDTFMRTLAPPNDEPSS